MKFHCSVHFGYCTANALIFSPKHCTHYLHTFCGSATLDQVLEDNREKFLVKMNSKDIAPTLYTLDLITEKVKLAIVQPTMTKRDANNELFQFLKGEVEDVKTVRKIFDVAAQMQGYGKMIAFAEDMLKKLAAVK